MNDETNCRDILQKLSFELSCGLGHETTTAEDYYKRIHEGIDNIAKPFIEENKQIREIFPKILEALNNGSGCVPNVSLEFLKEIPKEVEMVVKELNCK